MLDAYSVEQPAMQQLFSLSDIRLNDVTCGFSNMNAPNGDNIPLAIELVLGSNAADRAITAFNARKIPPDVFNDVLTLCDYLDVDNTHAFMLTCIMYNSHPADAYALAQQHSRNYQTLFEDICTLSIEKAVKFGCVVWLEHCDDYSLDVWQMASEAGQLACLKMMYSRECKHVGDDVAFQLACRNGHLEVAKWLVSLNQGIDVHARQNWAFTTSCFNNRLEVCKWLRSLDKGIYKQIPANAFVHVCENGHLDVAKWLLSLDEGDDATNAHAKISVAFQNCCCDGRLEVAKWLWSLKTNITVSTRDDAFRRSCANGHLEVADWLASLVVSRN